MAEVLDLLSKDQVDALTAQIRGNRKSTGQRALERQLALRDRLASALARLREIMKNNIGVQGLPSLAEPVGDRTATKFFPGLDRIAAEQELLAAELAIEIERLAGHF